MGVTAIKVFVNLTDEAVDFTNFENNQDDAKVNPHEAQNNGVWIPWCNNSTDYKNNHYVSFKVGGLATWYMWQRGDHVYAWKENDFNADAPVVNGYDGVDGDRVLVINQDGSLNMIKLENKRPLSLA